MNELFFLGISEYLGEPDELLDNLVEHRAWSKGAYDEGILLFSGRKEPPTGGVLAFRAPSLAAAEAFVASDPFSLAGLARYSVVAISPTSLPWRSAEFDAFMASGVNAQRAAAGGF